MVICLCVKYDGVFLKIVWCMCVSVCALVWWCVSVVICLCVSLVVCLCVSVVICFCVSVVVSASLFVGR